MSVSPRPGCWRCPDWPARAAASAVMLAMLLWIFRDLLQSCFSRWSTEPQYSHGFIIPLIAIGLAWFRRDRIPVGEARSHRSGVAIIAAGCLSHLIATFLYIETLAGIGLLLCLSGIVLLAWGKRLFRGIWPAVLFMGFMLPLPFAVERMLSDPLQVSGAAGSVWIIQAFGVPAIAQGNIILIGETRLGVAEACSGLRMLMVFFAISAAAVIVSDRSRWERLLMLVSAIPIALISNIARIVATAIAYCYASHETADLIFHDLSGWLMMPLAIALLVMELKTIDLLFVEVPDGKPGIAFHPMLSRIVVDRPQGDSV